jgi:hypothetical protein
MTRLKFHPRDALPDATLLARADALHVELTGTPRMELAEAIGWFRLALEHQDEAVITRAHEGLGGLVELLRTWWPSTARLPRRGPPRREPRAIHAAGADKGE